MNGYGFTEDAWRVLARAADEARYLHHAYIGTEHLLLAMTAVDSGAGGIVLQKLGADKNALRALTISTLQAGRNRTAIGPDLPYTSRAKKVLELAMTEAGLMNHSSVGTDHLLLGLLVEQNGIGAQVLNDCGVTLAAARAETGRTWKRAE